MKAAVLLGLALYTVTLSNVLGEQEKTDEARMDCSLSPMFRRFHDAASAGLPVDTATLADATPVKVERLAETIAFNYDTALHNQRTLEALQEWVRSQAKRPK